MKANDIIAATAKVCGVSMEAIVGMGRSRDAVEARQIAIYLIRRKTRLTLVEIGRRLSCAHSTIVHYYQQASDLLEVDKYMRTKCELIEGMLNEKSGMR